MTDPIPMCPYAGMIPNKDRSPIVDPTINVSTLVAGEVSWIKASIEQMSRRTDDLQVAHEARNKDAAAHTREILNLFAEHADKLRTGDLDVHDKTRQVDVLAAAASAATLATAVTALAATADRNAENLRNQLNATATAMAKQTADAATATATQTDSLMRGVNDRLSSVEKAINLGTGRQSVSDPQQQEFMRDIKEILTVQAAGSGKSAGRSDMWGYVVGAFGFLLTLAGLGSMIFAMIKSAP